MPQINDSKEQFQKVKDSIKIIQEEHIESIPYIPRNIIG